MKIYKKLTEEELQQIPLEELADRVTPSWRIRPNILELVRRVAEAEKRICELEADPNRPTVTYAGDELEACEEKLAEVERERDKWKDIADWLAKK